MKAAGIPGIGNEVCCWGNSEATSSSSRCMEEEVMEASVVRCDKYVVHHRNQVAKALVVEDAEALTGTEALIAGVVTRRARWHIQPTKVRRSGLITARSPINKRWMCIGPCRGFVPSLEITSTEEVRT